MKDIVSIDAPEDIYVTPVGCQGIIRRADTGNGKLNQRLRVILTKIASTMSLEEIEKQSRRQPRGSESGMAKLVKINKAV